MCAAIPSLSCTVPSLRLDVPLLLGVLFKLVLWFLVLHILPHSTSAYSPTHSLSRHMVLVRNFAFYLGFPDWCAREDKTYNSGQQLGKLGTHTNHFQPRHNKYFGTEFPNISSFDEGERGWFMQVACKQLHFCKWRACAPAAHINGVCTHAFAHCLHN